MDGGRTGKEAKAGILKSEKLKSQRSGSGSSENRDAQELLAQVIGCAERAPVSPQPSVDRLSVTWADPELSVSSASTKINLYHMGGEAPTGKDARFTIVPGESFGRTAAEGSEDEEYSASMSAFMVRRESTRRSRRARARRPSSPFLADADPFPSHRRCSMITTSSADTAASMEEGHAPAVVQEQLVENIRLHKEFISEVKQERLTMRKKLKLVHQAKAYIKRHEGQLQERLAQSKNTRDIMAKCNILLAAKWQHVKREAANMSNIMIPWELRIKEIESHFGSVVASYFTFLRWLFWVNLVISVLLVVFVIVPEMLTADKALAGERKVIYDEDKNASTNLLTLWEFEGVLKCSPIFYGYYTNVDYGDYRLPFAYFMTGLAVYIYSFVATLRKMAENSRMSKLSEKDDECIFSWKLFTGWDFMIGNAETAHNRTASIILSFKEALLEEEEKKKDPRNWRILSLRAFVNLCVLILLAISVFAVIKVVERSNEPSNHWWRQNEITIVMSLISNIFPILFEFLGMLEHYHPRKQLRVQLGRIMVLNLLNIYSLIFALFSKIDGMTTELEHLKPKQNLNESQHLAEMNGLLGSLFENDTHSCYGVAMNCKRCEICFTPPIKELTQADSNEIINISPAALIQLSPYMATTALSSLTFTSPKPEKILPKRLVTSFLQLKDPLTNKTIEENGLNKPYLTSISEINVNDHEVISQKKIAPLPRSKRLSPTSISYDLKKHVEYITNLAKETSLGRNSNDTESEENSDETVIYVDYNTIDTTISNKADDNTTAFKSTVNNYSEHSNDQNEMYTTTQVVDSKVSSTSQNEIDVYYTRTTNTISNERNWYTPEIALNSPIPTSQSEIVLITSESNSSEIEVLEDINDTSSTTDDYVSTKINRFETSTYLDGLTEELYKVSNDASTTPLFRDYETSEENFETSSTASTTPKSRISDNINTNINNKTTYKKVTIKDDSNSNSNIGVTVPASVIDIAFTNTYNATNSKTNTCYEIKCFEKPFYIAKRNASTNVTVNKSKDYIIDSSHNHVRYNLSMKTKKRLLTLCWETMFGQELVKLTMMDLVLCILGTLIMDFFRAVFVRYMNRCWCWNMEKKFPQYGDFKIAENILHLVNNQGMIWMGLFFSPGLAVLNLVKLVIMMYLRSWAVMTCNVPHEVVFRASRSNNFYLGLLLIMLFLCVLPVGYALVWVTPSWHCGPFSDYSRIYQIFTENLNSILPNKAKKISDYIASPGIVIPLLVLLILVIYYLTSLTNSLREANNDLKTQLRRERTEERRKMFQLADRRRRIGSAEMENTAFAKWKKILPMLPPGKSIDSDERRDSNDRETNVSLKKKGDIFAKIVNMALRRPVVEEKPPDDKTLDIPALDDETDTEFHEYLPADVLKSKHIRMAPKMVEIIKKRPNVEFVTTEDGKIKEDIVSPNLRYKKKVLPKKAIKYSDLSSGEDSETVKVKSELGRRSQIKFRTKEIIKAKLIEKSNNFIEEEQLKSLNSDSLEDKNDFYMEASKKIKNKQVSESSSQSKQSDSIGSVIPVITISKTESDDDMLCEVGPPPSLGDKEIVDNTSTKARMPEDIDIRGGSTRKLRKDVPHLKSLIRQGSVDSINDQKGGKEMKGDDGHKFQYSL